jgi:O-succinylbenzoic acid--CoA ligase
VPSLVAIAVTGPRFVGALTAAWSGGDAVLPVDPRLPVPARLALLEALAPAWVLGIDGAGHRRAGARPVAPGDALVVATSGTTGEPKGVVLTHEAVRASALASSARLGVDPARDHWLACLPLSHVGGLSVVTRALLTGTPLTVLERFSASAVAACSGPTLVSLVATAMARVDARRFRAVLLGGGPPPPGPQPANVIATYGSTETGSGIVYDGLPLDGVSVRIDGHGSVHVRGPMLGRAYRGPAGETPLLDADGWLATGDAGELVNGRLTVFGRQADVIVTGGEKVWPVAVERVLGGVPALSSVAVIGAPDRTWGQRVVAVAVVRPGETPPTLADLRDVVRASLPAYAAPRQLVLVDRLPMTGLGKVRRQAVARLLETAAESTP